MRIVEIFEDSDKILSIGRTALATGLLCSTGLAVAFFHFFRTSTTPTNLWDWAIVATPGLLGLGAYIFSKLYDVRAEIAGFVNKNKDLFGKKNEK